MIVNDFITPPVFHAGAFLSAYDCGVLLDDIAYLDQMSYRREPVFDNLSRTIGGESTTKTHPTTAYLLWRGGIVYRTGYSLLVVFYRRVGAVAGTARLAVYVNGVSRASIVPASGDGSTAVGLVGWSYVDGAALLIEVRVEGIASTDHTSEWWTTAVVAVPAYIAGPPLADPSLPVIVPTTPSPIVSTARPWIAMSPFTDVWDELKLNILSNNILHLYDKMNQVPMVGNRAYVWNQLNHQIGTDWELWSGSGSKYTSVDLFRIIGDITVFGGTDTLKVYMNDVLAWTLGPFGPGTTSFSQPIPYPAVGVGSRVRITITDTTTTLRLPSQGSRLNLLLMRSDPYGSGSYPALALSNHPLTGPLYSAASVGALLNACTAGLNSVKSRVDSSGSFSMVRACRDYFGNDDAGRRSRMRTNPMVFQRRGSRLVVYGKNVTMGFGGQTFELDENGANTAYKYKFNVETNIIQADKFEMKTIYLDAVKGLYPGDLYYLLGDFFFAAEWIA